MEAAVLSRECRRPAHRQTVTPPAAISRAMQVSMMSDAVRAMTRSRPGSSAMTTPVMSPTLVMTPSTATPAEISAAATAPECLQHHDLRADLYAIVEVDDIGVAHADAAGRHVLTDRPGLVRAVDTVQRRAEIHRARAQGIVRTAGHEMRQIRLPPDHFIGRRPVRPFFLRRHRMTA